MWAARRGKYARNNKPKMTDHIETPAAGTGGAASDESYEAYEARFLAGDTAAGDQPASDVTGSADEPEDTTASDSETEDTPEQDENDGEQEPAKPKSKGGFQRKIDKLNARIKELESQQLAGQTPPPAAAATGNASGGTAADAPQFSKPKPKLEDFDGIEQFTEALTDWKLEAKEFDRAEAAKQQTAQQQAQALIGAWNDGVERVKAAHTDYDRVIASAQDVQLPPAQQRLFLESKHGPELAYTLAQDPNELTKFAGLNPLDAAKYFGALEAKFSTSSAHNKTPVSTRAPRPPSTVGARSTASVDPFDPAAGDDYAGWERARNAQLQKRAA